MAPRGVNLTFGTHGLGHSFPYSTMTAGCSPLIFSTSTKTESPQTELGTQGSGTARSRPILHHRNLVVAGLRSKSRGNSAVRMTARDAAPLLAAVLACSQVRDSVEMVRGCSETYFHNITSGGYGDSPTAALRNLPPDHSFVDAIEALIAAAADGSLEPATYVITAEVKGEKFGYEAIIENYRPNARATWRYLDPRRWRQRARSVWSAQSIRPAPIVASRHRRSRRLEAESERLPRGK